MTDTLRFILAALVTLLIIWILYRAIRPQRPIIYLVYADWCGHCTNLKPDWEKLKNEFGNSVSFIDINEKNKSAVEKLSNKHRLNIDGYPTIFGVKKGSLINYDGFTNGKHTVAYLRNYISQISE